MPLMGHRVVCGLFVRRDDKPLTKMATLPRVAKSVVSLQRLVTSAIWEITFDVDTAPVHKIIIGLVRPITVVVIYIAENKNNGS